MKPFETYFGGKSGSGTYQAIINQIPPHRVYLEFFAGNGGVFHHKRAATISLLADIDLAVVDQWRKAGMQEVNQIDKVDVGAQIMPANALDLLSTKKQWFDRKDSFIYLDPPYPLNTRASHNRYDHELTDQEHKQLLMLIDGYHYARIAVSTYPNDLYGSMLSDWRKVEYSSTTRGGVATEWLFCNYPEPTELHDYSYVGGNYRERERIAKKVRRHVAKFRQLPELERKAIISALLQE